MPRKHTTPDPRREYQRSRILSLLAEEPLTSQQLADRMHLSRSGVQLHITAMKREKPRLVHIAGYTLNPGSQRPAPTYSVGDKKDAKCVKARAPKGRFTEAERHKQVLKMLKQQPRTAMQVAKDMQLARARIYVIQLHAAGKVHISDWAQQPDGSYRSPVYKAGPGQDAARPAPQTEHEKCARAWARLKANPQRHGHLLQRNRMRKKPQTWLSALMG